MIIIVMTLLFINEKSFMRTVPMMMMMIAGVLIGFDCIDAENLN